MLSIGKLAAGLGAGLYYVDQVARGAEDYYAAEGEAPGTWAGTGSAALGLRGHVDETGVLRLLEARDPATGALLRRPVAGGAVAGFDLTFRAPKSVGVLFGIADDRVAEELRTAHDTAVGQAMGYVERAACRARRGAGGAVVVRGGGFVAAAFEHRSSRAGDPLLHTHVVVANVTQGPDGPGPRWTGARSTGTRRRYREWGYTALSRHRIEARFYVSAAPAFLNQTETLVPDAVSVLDGSRAQQLALYGLATDAQREALRAEFEQACRQADESSAGLDAAEDRRTDCNPLRRRRRRAIDGEIEGWRRAHEHWRGEVDRIARELDRCASPRRADDEHEFEPARETRSEPTHAARRWRGHDRDFGIER